MKTSLRSAATLLAFVTTLAVASTVHAGPGIDYWKNRTAKKAPQTEAKATAKSTPPGPQTHCNACAHLQATAKAGS